MRLTELIRRNARLLALALVGSFALAGAVAIEAGDRAHECDHVEASAGYRISQKRGRFEALRDVALSAKVEEKLNAIAARYQKKTGKTFVVTSGIRDPDSQAELIYQKLVLGDDLLKLYKDKTAVKELVDTFEDGQRKRKSRTTIVTAIASTIRAQMKRGIYISAHLKAGAADVRSSSMTAADKRAFVEAAREVGGFSIMLESTPPHFHLQLD